MALQISLKAIGLGLVAAYSSVFINNAQAVNFNWNCADGSVSDITCWLPQQLPGSGDTLRFSNGGTANINTGDSLVSADSFVGFNGTSATINHAGGDNTTTMLYNGYNVNSPGTSGASYQLNGTATLNTLRTYNGYVEVPSVSLIPSVNATFSQDGGSHVTLDMLHGVIVQTGSLSNTTNVMTSTYNLNGGQLSVANNEFLGNKLIGSPTGFRGRSTFVQNGGAHSIGGNLIFADGGNLVAEYSLNGGSLDVGGDIVNGVGSATLNIDGGTLTMTNGGAIDVDTLVVGPSSSGSHTIRSGEVVSAVSQQVITGTISLEGGSNAVTNHTVSGSSLGVGTYIQSGGSFTASDERIGVSGRVGAVNQSGGTHSASLLSLGVNNSGSQGSYNLSGTGVLTSSTAFIGRAESSGATGTVAASFNQAGGSFSNSSNLYMGYVLDSSTNATADYTLTAGNLTASTEYIGYVTKSSITGTGRRGGSTAAFVQDGGTHRADTLYLGYLQTFASSSSFTPSNVDASYTLNGGDLIVTGNETIGFRSGFSSSVATLNADFVQNGGSHDVAGSLMLGSGTSAGRNSSYSLNAGNLSAGVLQLSSRSTFNGNGGTLNAATINQSGGTVNGVLQNQGIFNYLGGAFIGRLWNQGVVDYGSAFIAGDGLLNETTFDVLAGTTVSLNGSGLNNLGLMTVDGSLLGNGLLTNNGQMTLNVDLGGSGGMTNNALLTTANGIALANSGPLTNNGNMAVAANGQLRLTGGDLTNSGSFDLNGGVLSGTAALINGFGGTLSGRGIVATGFSNAGGNLLVQNGTTNILQAFDNSGLVQLAGFNANLAGGAMNNTGGIEGAGNIGNAVTNGGRIEASGGTLTMSGAVSNTGLMTAATGSKLMVTQGLAINSGVINLNGGTFDNNGHLMTNNNQVSGHGIVRTGGLTNAAGMTFTGGNTTINGPVTNDTGALITAAFSPLLFTGDVVNQGIISAQATNVTFAAGYSGSGSITGTGTSIFQGVVSPGNSPGTTTVVGDAVFDINATTLIEIGGYLQGASADNGYDLFAVEGTATLGGELQVDWWNGFSASAGDSFDILTAETIVGEFDLLTLALIGDGLKWNVDYILDDLGTDFLRLSVSQVPVPAAVWLFGSGLIALLGLGRRRAP